jgi:hypothetical protein
MIGERILYLQAGNEPRPLALQHTSLHDGNRLRKTHLRLLWLPLEES